MLLPRFYRLAQVVWTTRIRHEVPDTQHLVPLSAVLPAVLPAGIADGLRHAIANTHSATLEDRTATRYARHEPRAVSAGLAETLRAPAQWRPLGICMLPINPALLTWR